ncbi:MAG: hypothetical protein HQL84_09390 [Magnetococcales bacterium]|nr:hypothetical protein [Magnetococcales bacterium]MBF0150245.1 hypothetical protein [Magnetococcales bacterium]MBF0172781.1 hypothetical protein [Magnetococcales bacterium]MBF0347751.1 hypothetical protein [Magnetococcales bacterium]MBF0630028.1 hypothetical protein [Magnetococcales bacterium]
MTVILLFLLFLAVVFWLLLRLRTMRESHVGEELPPDKTTILVGLFYTLSRACIQHFRDKNYYPRTIIGSDGSLMELGYLKGDTLAEITSATKLFSIAISDRAGFGVCLAHTPAAMANQIVARIRENDWPGGFVDYKNGQFTPLETPVTRAMVNLTLPLPVQPVGTKPIILESAEPAKKIPTVILEGDEHKHKDDEGE